MSFIDTPEQMQRMAIYREAQASSVQQLREVGYNIDDIRQLDSFKTLNKEAILILCNLLESNIEDYIKAVVADLLRRKEADLIWQNIYDEFLRMTSRGVRDLYRSPLIEALGMSFTDRTFDQWSTFMKDTSFGIIRIFGLRGMKRSKKQHIISLIESLADDPDCGKEIRSWKR